MTRSSFSNRLPGLRHVCVAGLLALGVQLTAHAEAPMISDDAGTLDKGGMKVEAWFDKAKHSRATGLAFGFSPVDTLEIGLYGLRDKPQGGGSGNEMGLAFKWVPWKAGAMSAGLRLDLGQSKAGGLKSRTQGVTALFTMRAENNAALHFNATRAYAKEDGSEKVSDSIYSLGAEYPVLPSLAMTGDVYRSNADGAKTGTALGLRYTVKPGLKLYAGVDRQDSENTTSVGLAWEF